MEVGGLLQLEWQCPSCTLLNKAVSFKCRVCGTPKGTSTRQTKHSAAIEKQYVAESLHKIQLTKNFSKPGQLTPTCISPSSGQVTGIVSMSSNGRRRGKSKEERNDSVSGTSRGNKYPTLPNIDRTTGRSYTVTVDSISVIITEYDLLYPTSD